MLKGAFVISIDYEYALGFADFVLDKDLRSLMEGEVSVTRRLIKLFDKYDIPVTWAIVGHLLEDSCKFKNGTPHPEYQRPINFKEKHDWFFYHPKEGDYKNTLWFDSNGLIEDIKRASSPHEIASHSYSHIIYGAKDINKKAVVADIENIKGLNQRKGIKMSSFVFPRNKEAFHKNLKDIGFVCYRGNIKKWYERFPWSLKRLMRIVDYYLPTARTSVPSVGEGDLINIPDSIMLLSRNGLRSLVTANVMTSKLKRGLKSAVKRKEVFHLWFHTSNFWYKDKEQFRILEDVLREASKMRESGELDIVTMKSVANQILKEQS